MTIPSAVRRWLAALMCMAAAPATAVAQDSARPSDAPANGVAVARQAGSWVRARDSRVPPLRRTISLQLKDAPLSRALDAIARAAGITIGYGEDVLRSAVRVTLRADDMRLVDALTAVLDGTRLDAFVSMRGDALLVRAVLPASGPTGSIVGRVSDSASGTTLVGVDVVLEGQGRAVTDANGWYKFADVAAGTYGLAFRRIGYARANRTVVVTEGREDTVNVALAPRAARLEELVTTATGLQRRRDLGNDVTTINADSVMRTAPIRSLSDLLDGRVPGLTVQHTSGAPGDPAKLRLRGIGSILRSNDPVVVVDGIRIYAAQSEARSGNLTNFDPGTRDSAGVRVRANPNNVPAPSPLDQIDPNIIEKIEVFKGPSAATMYGADAANGVIVITTKRGKPGPTMWDASLSYGRTSVPNKYPPAYFRWGHEAFTTATRFCTIIDRDCVPDSLVTFQALNEPDLTILDNGYLANLSLTASGGTQAITYSITGSYSDETGTLRMPQFEVDRFRTLFNREPPEWMRRPHKFKEWSVTSNVRAKLGPTADVMLSTSLGRADQQRSTLETQLAPLMGTYIDTVNGIYYQPATRAWNGSSSGTAYLVNPSASFLQDYYTRQTTSSISLTTGLNATWLPFNWLTTQAQAGLNVLPRDDQLLLPAGLVSPSDSGSVGRGNGRSLVSTFNLQGTLNKPLGLGFAFITRVGANLVTSNTADLMSSASGLVPGTSSISNARRIASVEQRASSSVFGWYIEPAVAGQRLSLSAGLRIDGGSSYGTRITRTNGGLFGGFVGLPKLNLSWVISEEPWFPFSVLFSSLRLRGGYGQAQLQPSATDRLRLYTSAVDAGGQLLTLTAVGNTALKPERSTEFEGGFDAALLDDRLSVEFSVYRKLQVDALQPVQLPWSVNGGGTVMTNIGNVRNAGLNLAVGITPVRSPVATWSAELQFSSNANKLVKLGDGVVPNKELGVVEGFPVNSRWARPILGFVDQNGDRVLQAEEIQVGDSLVYMGRLAPASETNLHTNLALFSGAVGVTADFAFSSGATQVDQTARRNWVLVRALVDPAVPLADQAAVLASTKMNNPTDYGLMQQFSTIRFKSLSVNYHAPPRIARLLKARDLWVGLKGSNLGLHSTYSYGRDPDVSAWMPGENIADTGQLPLPRTWQLSARLTY